MHALCITDVASVVTIAPFFPDTRVLRFSRTLVYAVRAAIELVSTCNIVCTLYIVLALSFTVEIFAEKHISIYCSASKSSANQMQ